MKENGSLISEIRPMQKIVFSIFNRISVTRANGINSIQEIMSKFVFTQMTEANPQPSKENETWEPV